jgi:hypothetical protein
MSIAALESPSRVGDCCSSKAIFYGRYVGKMLFLQRFFPKVGNPVFLADRSAFSFNF